MVVFATAVEEKLKEKGVLNYVILWDNQLQCEGPHMWKTKNIVSLLIYHLLRNSSCPLHIVQTLTPENASKVGGNHTNHMQLLGQSQTVFFCRCMSENSQRQERK